MEKSINLRMVYELAKGNTSYSEFKAEIDRLITGQLSTVESKNEFKLILK